MPRRQPAEQIIHHTCPTLTMLDIVQRQLVILQIDLEAIDLNSNAQWVWRVQCSKWQNQWRVTPERRAALAATFPRARDDLMHEVMDCTSYPKVASAYLNLTWVALSGLMLGTVAFARALGGTPAAQRCLIAAALARWQRGLELAWGRKVDRLAESVDHDSNRAFRTLLQVQPESRAFRFMALTRTANDHRALPRWEAARLGIFNAKVGELVHTPDRCVEGLDLNALPIFKTAK